MTSAPSDSYTLKYQRTNVRPLPSVSRISLALGLFLFGVGVCFFAIGGSGIATAEIVKGGFRGSRALVFLIVVGLSALVVGSALVAYSFGQTSSGRSDVDTAKPGAPPTNVAT